MSRAWTQRCAWLTEDGDVNRQNAKDAKTEEPEAELDGLAHTAIGLLSRCTGFSARAFSNPFTRRPWPWSSSGVVSSSSDSDPSGLPTKASILAQLGWISSS